MDILLLRFDAPLMSFGGVMVDQHGPTERFPGLSLLAGLFGNALGFTHGEADKLEALQARIEYAARWDVEPEPLLDYHTVDLGQPKMREPGWTTHGAPEHRGGGPDAKFGTHIRYRHYWANGVMTVAITLLPSPGESAADQTLPPDLLNGSLKLSSRLPLPLGEGWGEGDQTVTISTVSLVDALQSALQTPARPLFLGRKTCLPATPIFLARVEADNVLEALRHAPLAIRPQMNFPSPSGRGARGEGLRQACWPARLGETPQSRTVPIYDRRDWRNQIHAGRRLRIEGLLEVLP